MEEDLYLNKNYFDTQRCKYHAVEVIKSDNNSILFKSDEGKVLKICKGIRNTNEYRNRFEWLKILSKKSDLAKYVVLPTNRLEGLKTNEIGYVCDLEQEVNLNFYIHPPKGEKLFKWYYDKTGGIEYRLKIAYNITTMLEQIHNLGFCLVDICPENIMLNSYSSTDKKTPSIQFIGADNICSYTQHPIISGSDMYCDPLVSTNRSINSTSSDTFSFAVMLFELLTTCHPFVGEGCEDLSNEEIVNRVNSGSMDYIDDYDKDNNRNEDYEDTKLFLSKDLSYLFYKIFVPGKFNASQRPSLSEFKSACLKSMQRLIKCSHEGCGREYPYNAANKCPFCNYLTTNVLFAKVNKIISSSEELLLPYDGKTQFTTLPIIEEMVNFMIIKPGLNKFTKSFFDPTIKSDSGATGIWIQYSDEKAKIAIRNRFNRIELKVDKKKLIPQVKAENKSQSDITLDTNSPIAIEIPANVLLDSEEIIDFETEEYGKIQYKWILTIG